jgi:hypothetical protein
MAFLGGVDLESAETQKSRQEWQSARNLMAITFQPESVTG